MSPREATVTRESLVDSLEALGFTLGKYTHPFGEADPTRAATYTVFAAAAEAEAEAALRRLVGDAAELRAAITAYLAALDEFRKQEATLRALPEGMGIGQAGVSAAYNLDDAEAVLRRLAASEGQP